MKKITFLLFMITIQLIYSQDITFTGDLTVTTQAEIDALPENYTHITGRLDILGGDGDISDLSKFSDLKDIGRRLLIQDCPLLTDLTGLSSLEAVGSLDANEELVIRRMDGLTTLDGLQSLTSVGRRVGIRQNPALTTLEGLNNLVSIGENKITIGDDDCDDTDGEDLGNDALTDYCALGTLTSNIGVTALLAGGSCIVNNATFNPTFQDIADGNCSTPLSVDSFTDSSIQMYPNPASDILNIESSGNIDSVSIFNITGQELLKTNALELNISRLSNGLYFVKINSGDKSVTKKLIKQ